MDANLIDIKYVNIFRSIRKKTVTMTDLIDDSEILDYEDDNELFIDENKSETEIRGNYVSIHSSGFRDLMLKPEILKAISDFGFEHPSEGKL